MEAIHPRTFNLSAFLPICRDAATSAIPPLSRHSQFCSSSFLSTMSVLFPFSTTQPSLYCLHSYCTDTATTICTLFSQTFSNLHFTPSLKHTAFSALCLLLKSGRGLCLPCPLFSQTLTCLHFLSSSRKKPCLCSLPSHRLSHIVHELSSYLTGPVMSALSSFPVDTAMSAFISSIYTDMAISAILSFSNTQGDGSTDLWLCTSTKLKIVNYWLYSLIYKSKTYI